MEELDVCGFAPVTTLPLQEPWATQMHVGPHSFFVVAIRRSPSEIRGLSGRGPCGKQGLSFSPEA